MENEMNQTPSTTPITDGSSESREARWEAKILAAREEAKQRGDAQHEQLLEQLDEFATNQARIAVDVIELRKKLLGEEPKTFAQKAHRTVKEVAEVVTPYFMVGIAAFALGKGASSAYSGTRGWWANRQATKNAVSTMPVSAPSEGS